jgi:hypothetical protein
LKRVYVAANLPEAHLLSDWLAGRGIPTRIFNANASSLAGELPVDCATPQIWVVDPGHAERARQLIEEYSKASVSGPARACPACGEDNPPSFDLCWACGAGLEG